MQIFLQNPTMQLSVHGTSPAKPISSFHVKPLPTGVRVTISTTTITQVPNPRTLPTVNHELPVKTLHRLLNLQRESLAFQGLRTTTNHQRQRTTCVAANWEHRRIAADIAVAVRSLGHRLEARNGKFCVSKELTLSLGVV